MVNNYNMNAKKYILLLVFLISTVIGSAQTSSFSICGIPMGTEKSEAEKILKERFGLLKVRDDAGDLSILDGQAGGIYHKFMTFNFSWINGKSVLNGATFSTPFELNEQKRTTEFREFIKSVYEKKYRIKEYVNEDGYKCYEFGDIDSFVGNITVHKSKSKDGKTRLFTDIIYYAPYDVTDDI